VPVVRDPPPEADRLQPGKLVAVALVSMAVGFLAVYLPGRGNGADGDDPPATARPGPDAAQEERSAPVLAVDPRPARQAAPGSAGAAEASSSPEPEPASATPSAAATTAADGGAGAGGPLRARVGDVYYWRCWDEGRDDPLPSEHCERLRALEGQIAEQVGAIEACARERGAGPGKLSLGIELNFTASSSRFWGGRSSTVANAAEVAGCLRGRWRIDLESIRHLHARYSLFVPVDLEPR
jgi:hypothetical protein